MTWAPDYATASQLKGWLRIADTVDDTEIGVAISAASRAIDAACGRQFGQVDAAETRTYEARFNRHRGCGRWEVAIDDLDDLTDFQVFVGSTEVTAAYSFSPPNALAKGGVYTTLILEDGAEAYPTSAEPNVYVYALWGWSAVPTTILQALKLQASRLLARRDSPYGVAGSPDQGTELRLLAKVDPDVELLLKKYRRHWWAA